MNKKVKILFVSTQLPYPPDSGGKIKSWHYLNDLSKRYEVSFACFLKDDSEEKVVESFKNKVELQDFYFEKLHINRNPFNLIKSYFGHACLNVYRNYTSTFKKKIATIADDFDLLLIDHYEMFQYVPKNYRGKVVLHTHNAEFMLWQRMAELTTNPFVKALLNVETARVKNYEKQIFCNADLIYATDSDIKLYEKENIPTDNFHSTYHLGNSKMLELEDTVYEDTEPAITFMGTLNWEPNVDGIIWFISEVWPRITSKHKNIKLYILGKKGNPKIYEAAQGDENIVFTGFVKNLDLYLKKTRVYIVPLRFGSGMKVKVLEGLYRGVPMVSTTVGAEGLALENNQDLLIADEATTFANACLTLYENKTTWEKLRNNSRKVAKKLYLWDSLFEKMDVALKSLLQKK